MSRPHTDSTPRPFWKVKPPRTNLPNLSSAFMHRQDSPFGSIWIHLDPFGTPESRSPHILPALKKCGIEISVSESRRVSQSLAESRRWLVGLVGSAELGNSWPRQLIDFSQMDLCTAGGTLADEFCITRWTVACSIARKDVMNSTNFMDDTRMIPGCLVDFRKLSWIFKFCVTWQDIMSHDPKTMKKNHTNCCKIWCCWNRNTCYLAMLRQKRFFLKNNWLFVDSFFAFLCSCRDKNWSSWSLHLGLKYFSHPSFPKKCWESFRWQHVHFRQENIHSKAPKCSPWDRSQGPSKALLERPQEGVGAFGIAGWRVRKLRPGGLFQTNSADEFWEIQSPTTCHRWFCRQIIGTEAWWQGAQGGHRPFTSLYHLYPSTLINPNSLPLKHVETSRSYAAMLAMLSVLLCALLCVSYVFLCPCILISFELLLFEISLEGVQIQTRYTRYREQAGRTGWLKSWMIWLQ